MYVSIDGETSGPYAANEIFDFIGNGSLRPTDEIWIEGTETTFPAIDLLPASGFANAPWEHSRRHSVDSESDLTPVVYQSRPAGILPTAGILVGAGVFVMMIPIIAATIFAVVILVLFGLKLN